jgi:predicted lipoprotein with Yx(FWY)xxD motif
MKIVMPALTILMMGIGMANAAEPAQKADTPNGAIYTDASGMALYTFDKDSGGKSACDGECATKWPPFKAATDAVAEGEWTLVERTDGSMMWAYKGKPLYTYEGDKKPGEVTGDGMGGVWHIAKAE